MTPGTLSVVLRSTLFAAFQVALTVPYSLIALATFPLPLRARYRVITLWTRLNVWAAQAICGIRYRVLGADALPPAPYIVLSKHQSAWETIALPILITSLSQTAAKYMKGRKKPNFTFGRELVVDAP